MRVCAVLSHTLSLALSVPLCRYALVLLMMLLLCYWSSSSSLLSLSLLPHFYVSYLVHFSPSIPFPSLHFPSLHFTILYFPPFSLSYSSLISFTFSFLSIICCPPFPPNKMYNCYLNNDGAGGYAMLVRSGNAYLLLRFYVIHPILLN